MAESKKVGLFSKLFGTPKSACCNMRIEQVTEEETGKDQELRPSCCGGSVVAPINSAQTEPNSTPGEKEN